MKRALTVVIERDPEANVYVGEVPGIAGCHSQGESVEELMANMKEVAQLCLEEAKPRLELLPKFIGTREIEVEA